MDYSTMSPVEVDTILVKAMRDNAESTGKIDVLRHRIGIFNERIAQFDQPYLKIGKNEAYYAKKTAETKEALATTISGLERAETTVAETRVVIREISDEFDSRGGWTRYFLVMNTNGHVHTSTHCSTTFPTTQWAWLPEQAGLSSEELVGMAGEGACTVCFPDAPIDQLRKPNTLDAPERREAREQREKEKAERERVKQEKSITAPDGSVLRTPGRWGTKIKTVAEAQRRILVSNLADFIALDAGKYESHNPDYRTDREQENAVLLDALAHKFADRLKAEGMGQDDLLKEYQLKAQKKFKRDWK